MKRNVLIVEDEKDLANGLAMLLEDDVDNVVIKYNGKEALDYLLEHKDEVACILSDINMPVMDGIEFIKNVRDNSINIPFVFYTGHGSSDLMLEVVKYNVFDFLHKPNFEGLSECMKRALDWKEKGQKEDEMSHFLMSDSEYQELVKSLEGDED